MPLSVKPPVQSLPSYSLTSDLLGFLRCGLQYRYTRVGNLPSSHPVQLWFGQFIHGVLEDAYRHHNAGTHGPLPWDDTILVPLMEQIDRRLAAQNIRCWGNALELGQTRARAAVNELGPLIFPLINQAEVRVRGARLLPASVRGFISRDIDRYEMLGVIDVVTEIELFRNPALANNPLLELIINALPEDPPQEFEVIVDYKGMKRPDIGGSGFSSSYEWQIHTYAHLRQVLNAGVRPVIAGVLIYLNELVPTKSDFYALRRAQQDGDPSVLLPNPGSTDADILENWTSTPTSPDPPLLSFDYRLKRAIKVIPITEAGIEASLNQFDDTVGRIETCLADEQNTGVVINSWEKNSSHDQTCEACDAKTYCPDYGGIMCPRVPGR